MSRDRKHSSELTHPVPGRHPAGLARRCCPTRVPHGPRGITHRAAEGVCPGPTFPAPEPWLRWPERSRHTEAPAWESCPAWPLPRAGRACGRVWPTEDGTQWHITPRVALHHRGPQVGRLGGSQPPALRKQVATLHKDPRGCDGQGPQRF